MNTIIAMIMMLAIGTSNCSHMTTNERYVFFENDGVYVQEITTWDLTGGSIERDYSMSYDEWNHR